MDRLQKVNFTPFAADFGLAADHHAMEYVVAICKVSYKWDQYGHVELVARDEMQDIFFSDVYYDKPDNSNLMYASDLVVHKPGADIVVVGNAYVQGRQRFAVGFDVNGFRKILIVNVPKNCRLDKIPMRYEYAYANSLVDRHGRVCLVAQKLDGISMSAAAGDKKAVPIFELPKSESQEAKILTDAPVGLGCIPMGWKPRFQYAGTFDDNWYHTRRPLFPMDFDRRFYNTVSQDQVLPGKIKGGETVKLFGLHPKMPIVQFRVPVKRIRVAFYIKNQAVKGEMAADTLVLEPDKGRFSVTYRSACSIGSSFRYIKRVEFSAN